LKDRKRNRNITPSQDIISDVLALDTQGNAGRAQRGVQKDLTKEATREKEIMEQQRFIYHNKYHEKLTLQEIMITF
jgi:hypothetical protein